MMHVTEHAALSTQVSCHKEQSSQDRPEYELADIFRLYGKEYRKKHTLTPEQGKSMYAIEHCRTSVYGYHADICDECGHIERAYNSCRNRHCPKCQGIAKRKWVGKRLNELLPVSYHHATFTLSDQISHLSLYNQKLIYDLLFEASSKTLLAFGEDPTWLGAKTGFYGILHTWSQTLWPHVHIHYIVPVGGLTETGEWIEPKYKKKFLFPVKALSSLKLQDRSRWHWTKTKRLESLERSLSYEENRTVEDISKAWSKMEKKLDESRIGFGSVLNK